ncbi:diacylglycerol O-acyltransferase 1 [Coelomomyces lativittatus]|nr:diacylglycerol O-acyltransferase 1 [Coelomomyces lativittatus]
MGMIISHPPEFMPIQFAPLDVPLHRRRQTLGTLIWILILPLSLLIFFTLLYCTYTRLITLFYVLWMIFWDHASETGARRSMWVRRWVIWKWMVGAFCFFP